MVGDTDTEGSNQPIALSAHQNELAEAVAAANPRTIVVVKSGSAVLMPWIDKVPAFSRPGVPARKTAMSSPTFSSERSIPPEDCP